MKNFHITLTLCAVLIFIASCAYDAPDKVSNLLPSSPTKKHLGDFAADVLSRPLNKDEIGCPAPRPALRIREIDNTAELSGAKLLLSGYELGIPSDPLKMIIALPGEKRQAYPQAPTDNRPLYPYKVSARGPGYSNSWDVDKDRKMQHLDLPASQTFECLITDRKGMMKLQIPSDITELDVVIPLADEKGAFYTSIRSSTYGFVAVFGGIGKAEGSNSSANDWRNSLLDPIYNGEHLIAALVAAKLSPEIARQKLKDAQLSLLSLSDEELFQEVLNADEHTLRETDDVIVIAKMALLFHLQPRQEELSPTVWRFKRPKETIYMMDYERVPHSLVAFDNNHRMSWKGNLNAAPSDGNHEIFAAAIAQMLPHRK